MWTELLARVEGEVVPPVFHRDDPAVEKVSGRDHLAAEVVHQEDSAVGLELDWRLVELDQGVEGQIEHGEGELASGEHHGATAPYPAGV
jgi:hypothetical protein